MTHHTSDIGPAIFRLLLAIAAAAIATSLVPLIAEPALPGLKATIYALATVFTLILLRPQASATVLSIWCLAGTLLTVAVVLADPVTRPLLPHLPAMLLTLFLLATTFALVARYLQGSVTAAVFVLLALAPVWAAPLVEVMNNPAWLNHIVINVSPITAIASSLDLDYLRSEWFYANSALGSMRYTYPDTAAIVAVLAVVPLTALLIEQAVPAFRKEAHS